MTRFQAEGGIARIRGRKSFLFYFIKIWFTDSRRKTLENFDAGFVSTPHFNPAFFRDRLIVGPILGSSYKLSALVGENKMHKQTVMIFP